MKTLPLFALLLLIAACGDQSPQPEGAALAAAASAVTPAIVSPQEAADPTEALSYEVAIASAAAEHNTARKRCAEQPEAVRTQCEQEANASFGSARDDLTHLRGNTP